MSIKSIIRKIAFYIISQPKAHVRISLQQVYYGCTLANKSIVVTGGSKGIGYAMAKKFISEGAKVVITGRKEADLANATKQLGTNADYIVFDLSNTRLIEAFYEQCKAKLGSIDSMVLNAGVSLHEGNFMNVTQEGFDTQFDINLKSNYFIAQVFLKDKLKEETAGNLLFISSLIPQHN